MTTLDVLMQAANALSEAAVEIVNLSDANNPVAIRARAAMKLVDAEPRDAADCLIRCLQNPLAKAALAKAWKRAKKLRDYDAAARECAK